MTKKELADKVRAAAQKIASTNDKLETPTAAAFKYSPMLDKFPKLQETLIDLMSEEFTTFVEDIEWVAPRPTTFKVILANEQYFYLIYGQRSWTAKVSGKKYYLNNINEEQNAAKAIADLLMYGPAASKEEVSGEVPTGGETPPDETSFSTPAETPPTEEPAATEEVPEEVPA
jgi:hypothetical protein